MVDKHLKLEDQLSRFTGQDGGHGRDDRADAFAWPIYKYVVRRRRTDGAAGAGGAGTEDDQEENDKQSA